MDNGFHYGYLFYNFKDVEIKLGQHKCSYDFIQIYGKSLTYKNLKYSWDGTEIKIVTPIYDTKDYTVDDDGGNMSLNHKFALNFQNIIGDRSDIAGTHNLLKYL